MEKNSIWKVLQLLRRVQADNDPSKCNEQTSLNENKINIDSHLTGDEFIDCGPSPPAIEIPTFFDNFEYPHSNAVVKICYHTIERNIWEHMKQSSGRAKLLHDIKSTVVNQDNLLEVLFDATQIELNICFLWAALVKRWDLLVGLINLGADLHYHEPVQGLGALHLTAFTGCVPGTEILIGQGCMVDALFKCYTPLHCAAFGDSPDTCLVLLRNGAQLQQLTNTLYEEKETALHCAIRANAHSCVRLLVSQGADVAQVVQCETSPLHLAADLGHVDCLRALIEPKGININVKTKENHQTPLHLAAIRGSDECLALLLKKGANPNAKNHMGQTPLHLAARMQDFTCLQLLLLEGLANPNTEDKDKRTPLHAAVGRASRTNDIIALLVECGANVNVKDQYGYTPLHIAALKGLAECVETLIYHGADVSAKSKSGMTALNIITKKVPASFSMFIKKLDSAITLHHRETSNHEIELRLDFRVILQYCHPREINFLDTLVDEGYKRVLLHPLCSALLYLKWRKIRKYYIARIIFSCLFVMTLSLYVLTALAHHCYNYGKKFNEMKSEDVIELCEKQSIMGKLLRDNPFVMEMQWFVLVGITCCEIFRKMYGIPGYHSLKQYFSYPENIIEWTVIISVFVISFIYTGRTYTWQNHIGAFAILLGWTNLMLMVGQLPLFGSYIAMYTRVQSEFAKLLLAYSGLLIGFTLTFCVIFPDYNIFANPFIALITVFVMLSGELNLDILVDDNPDNPHFLLECSAQVIYIVFVLTMTIILMNLLVGIAVDDIKGLQKTATLSKLVRQTKLISHMELALFNGNLPRYLLKVLHWTALVSPKSSQVVLNLKPLNPKENRLPKDVMKAAFHIAERYKRLVHSTFTLNDRLDFYNINKELHNHEDCMENMVPVMKIYEEIKQKNEEIDLLQRSVLEMRKLITESQETTENLLRTLLQVRRGSRC